MWRKKNKSWQSWRQEHSRPLSWFQTDHAAEKCARWQFKDNHDRRTVTSRYQLRRDTQHVAFCRSCENDQNARCCEWIANGEVDSGVARRNRTAETYGTTDDDDWNEWWGIMSWQLNGGDSLMKGQIWPRILSRNCVKSMIWKRWEKFQKFQNNSKKFRNFPKNIFWKKI